MKNWILRCGILFLSGCSLLPGMQNPSISGMPQVKTADNVTVNPVLVPITSALLKNDAISLYVYHVAPADILSITVWHHPEFEFSQQMQSGGAATTSTQGAAGQAGYLVNPYGNIYFPWVGNVKVAGKTVDQIREILAEKLKRYVRKPQVYVG